MKYKLLAFDIDGTLTNSDKKITQKTKAAIMKAVEQGCKIIVASGRPVQGIRAIARELELDKNGGYILSLNGGLLIDCSDNSIIQEIELPKEYYGEICDLAHENKVNILTYEGDDVITEDAADKYVEVETRINGLGCRQIDNLKDYITFLVPKFLMLGDGDYLAKVEKKVYEKLHDRMDVYRSEPFFLEILPKNINKASALEKLLEATGVKREELMAFGDGYNDLSMIEFAGMGVAMSNGNEIVKSRADYIAPSNDEDGIACVLEKFVLD